MDYTNFRASAKKTTTKYDEGLRKFLLQVYNYMAVALGVSGLVAFFASESEAFMSLMYNIDNAGRLTGITGLGYLAMFAPLIMVIALSAGINRMSFATAQMAFWGYAVLMGISIANIFLMFTGESIVRTFFITASVFGAMSLYGYTTKRDLLSMGSFLMMGLIGVIIVSIVNIFMQSSAIQFATSVIALFIFIGLTAYDTQKLKVTYYQFGGASAEAIGKAALMGALSLYLDFINIFMQLLYLFGDRK